MCSRKQEKSVHKTVTERNPDKETDIQTNPTDTQTKKNTMKDIDRQTDTRRIRKQVRDWRRKKVPLRYEEDNKEKEKVK